MDTLDVSLAVLDWAASQAGKTLDALADDIVAERNRERFLSGKLTVRQLEKVAALTSIPFGFLFLEKPPVLSRPKLPDMRQIVNPAPFGRDFFDVLEDIQSKQSWYIDYLKEVGAEPLPFVGKYGANSNPALVAQDIVHTAGITAEIRQDAKTSEDYYRALAEKFENIGILVFKSGIVKSNTKKGLSVAEFRGFAICDPLAPVVFINGKDADAAWIFTLAHEVAHIWVGESAVSDIPAPTDFKSHANVEYLCNKIAAEILTPTAEFLAFWDGGKPSIEMLSKHFKVSRLVVARRALDLGKIDKTAYNDVYQASWKATGPGGDPYKTIPVRNSKKLTNALVRSAMEGSVLVRDAARLLNVTPDTVASLYNKNIRTYA